MKYPEMIKSNARYRGPMESRKQTNSAQDIYRSIELLQQEFGRRKESTDSLMGDILTQYNEVIPHIRTSVINEVQSVKGGEL